MSQPPYSPYPHYSGPPSGPPPRGGPSNKARFWIGVALAIPALIAVAFLSAAPSIVADTLGASSGSASDLAGVMTLLIDVVLSGLFIAAIVWAPTRYLALGMLAGVAILLVLGAGACVVLLASYAGSV